MEQRTAAVKVRRKRGVRVRGREREGTREQARKPECSCPFLILIQLFFLHTTPELQNAVVLLCKLLFPQGYLEEKKHYLMLRINEERLN